MFCPKCNSDNIRIESVQENLGTTSVTRTTYKTTIKRTHGLLYKLFIGWWVWLIALPFKLLLWPFTALRRVLNRGKIAKSHGSTESVNHIVYKTICTCQNCGNTWEVKTK